MAARDRPALAAVLLAAACVTAPYEGYPLDLPAALPADAFARCRDVMAREYGGIDVDDPAAFLLRTRWAPVVDPPGERRASLYRGGDARLVVVVELRRLTEPVFAMPRWTEPRGWDAAERELAEDLREKLFPTVTP